MSCKVSFGGSYREHWTEDYTMSVEYMDRSTVTAEKTDGVWRACGGDGHYAEILNSDDCPQILKCYFEAAAEVWTRADECLAGTGSLKRLPELYRFGENPLEAPELLRLLVDDCGFGLEDAYDIVLRCCDDCRCTGIEPGDMYSVQPRTAHLISIMRQMQGMKVLAYHDSALPEYRELPGAVREGAVVGLKLRLLSGQLSAAKLIFRNGETEQVIPMEKTGDGFEIEFKAPEKAAACSYCFLLEGRTGAHYLCPDESGHMSEMYGSEQEGFRFTVFDRDFSTPEWFKKSVMYQIFPDRFAKSADGTAERGIAYHKALGRRPELHASFSENVRWQPLEDETDYHPEDFFGGTLNGIRSRLDYLQKLGISCIYLNPIVEARSNHRYDTADYSRVDPILGTEEDFINLCRAAEERGMRIILDGVFSHTGADSVYFNREGTYGNSGAYRDTESPYYSWYDFKKYPDKYRCWWGFADLPEVDELNEDWQNSIIKGPDGIVRTWLRRGASGWRLDVADELPDEALSLIRREAKAEKPDAPIIGEVWEDPVIKESYGKIRNYALGYSLDSVMNYPLRIAILDFMHRRTDAFEFRDFLISQRDNYPGPLYYSLMNLIGSHDVERVRNALATDVVIKSLPREKQMELVFTNEAMDRALETEKVCAAIQFMLPGVPSIYYGDEQGMSGVGDPFNRAPFKESENNLFEFYASLAAMRRSEPALTEGTAEFRAVSSDTLEIIRSIPGKQLGCRVSNKNAGSYEFF